MKKAPGKIILVGDMSVIAGFTGVVAAIDLFCEADFVTDPISVDDSNTFLFKIPSLAVSYKLLSNSYFDKTDWNIPLIATIKYLVESRITKDDLKNKHVKLTSYIPPYQGVGSSSASSASLAKLITSNVYNQNLNVLINSVWASDKICHGIHASGIDAHICIIGGIILYNRNNGAEKIPIKRNYSFLLGFPCEGGRSIDSVKSDITRCDKLGILTEALVPEITLAIKQDDSERLKWVLIKSGHAMMSTFEYSTVYQELVHVINTKFASAVKPLGTSGPTGILIYNEMEIYSPIIEFLEETNIKSIQVSIFSDETNYG